MTGRYFFKLLSKPVKFISIVFSFIPSFLKDFIWALSSPFEGKVALLLRYVITASSVNSCGVNVYIGKGVTLKNKRNLTIGDNVSIHANSYLDAAGGIFIGDNVSIAHNSSLVSFEHSWGNYDLPIKYNSTILKEIIVSDDVWIGCGARVLAGSKVNTRVIVAAGCVVKGELDEKSIYAGVPCRKIKEL